MQTETMRDKTFNMRLTPEEWASFEAVAKHYALPVASLIRMLVKRESDSIELARPSGSKKGPKRSRP